MPYWCVSVVAKFARKEIIVYICNVESLLSTDIFISESVSLILDTKSGKFHLRKDNEYAHRLYRYAKSAYSMLPHTEQVWGIVYLRIGIPEPRIR